MKKILKLLKKFLRLKGKKKKLTVLEEYTDFEIIGHWGIGVFESEKLVCNEIRGHMLRRTIKVTDGERVTLEKEILPDCDERYLDALER